MDTAFNRTNYSMVQREYSLHLYKPVSWSHTPLPKSCSISWRHATSTRITQPLLNSLNLFYRLIGPRSAKTGLFFPTCFGVWGIWVSELVTTQMTMPLSELIHSLTSIQGLMRILLQTKEVQKSLPLEKVCERPWIWFVSRNNFPQCVRAAKKLSEYVNPGFSYNFLHKYQDGKFDARLVLYTIFITNLTVMVLFLLDQYSFFCSCICIRFDFLRLHVNYL